MASPHHGIGGFEIAGVARRIEKRLCFAVARELLLDPRQATRILREIQGDGFIGGRSVGDQFRQTDGRKQAGADAAGKARSG